MSQKRVFDRYPCELVVTVSQGDVEFTGIANNVSLGGMHIKALDKVEFQSKVSVRFELPDLKTDATIEGIARWVTPDGFGVQFGALKPLYVWALHRYFKRIAPSGEEE